MFRVGLLILCFVSLASWCFAQDERTTIKKSLIPAVGSDTRDFIPAGWKLEEQLSADLDGDGTSDYVLKLIEDKPKPSDDTMNDRARALIVLLQGADGKLSRAAVADKLLQCTGCGGLFYGVVDAPANVKIENGVIVVEQDHGSRWTSDMTFRFRYEAESKKFLLIGFDFISNDRLERNTVSESTNFLTGLRIVKRMRQRETTSRAQVPKTKIYIDDVDYQKFDEDALHRFGLG
jgi:hypothetical protein